MTKLIKVKEYDGYGQIVTMDNEEYIFKYDVKGDKGEGVLCSLGDKTKTFPIIIAAAAYFLKKLEIEKPCKITKEIYETAIEALHKHIPIEPKDVDYEPLKNRGWENYCPICRCLVYNPHEYQKQEYCCNCGQKLDWK